MNDSIWKRISVVGDKALMESGKGSQLFGIKPRGKKESGVERISVVGDKAHSESEKVSQLQMKVKS